MDGINWENLPKCPPNLVSYYETIWGVCKERDDCYFHKDDPINSIKIYSKFLIHYHDKNDLSFITDNGHQKTTYGSISDILYAIDQEEL